MWFVFQHSFLCGSHSSPISISALGFPWYRSSRPDPDLEKVLRYDLIIGRRLFPSHVLFHVGEQKVVKWCHIRRMWREGDQPVQSRGHAQQQPFQPQTCVQEHCPGETGLPSSVFQVVHEISQVLYFSKS